MALSPGVRLGVYEVTTRIAEGGMGVVWRARDTRLQRDVALKILPDAFAADPDRLARFEREARTLASLNHPNIAQVYGLEALQERSDAASPAQVLVMELVEGPTLADRIAQGALSLDDGLPIARQIAEALEAAHEQGIVHRDLKPANVKVRPDGTVKVLDFGLAKAIEPAGFPAGGSQTPTITTPAMTQAGVILGTAAYMSPEQARGRAVDRRTDIWAFGCVLYEMLTGRQAFDGEDVMALLARIQEREPDLTALPARTPSAIRRLIRRCLVKDPRQRLSDAGTARLEIDEARAAPEDAPVTTGPSPRWRPALVAAIVVLAASLATGVAVWLAVRPALRITLLDVVPPRTAPLVADVGLGTSLPNRLFALVPDGSGLVYVSTGSDGGRRLMLHHWDQLEPAPVTGTDGALSPFISPDGQWIAYFNNLESLMRVGIDGGVPHRICNLSAAFPGMGAWRADGTIVFTTGSPNALWSVPATGGEPNRLSTAEAGENYGSPQWLPDGSGVLFTIRSQGDIENGRAVVFDWSTREIEDVWQGAIRTRYVPSGHLVYAAAGALWAVRFDVDTRTVTGTAFRVLDADPPEFEVWNDGTLAIVRGGPAGGTRLMLVDREGIETPFEDLGHGLYFQPRFSRDESRVAYYHADAGNDVEVLNLQNGRVNRVTQRPGQDFMPVWVDAESLVFASPRSGAMNVYRKRADGSGEAEQLTNSENLEYPLQMTTDGRIVMVFGPRQDDVRIGLKAPDLESEVVTVGSGRNPTVSPDNRWLAYESDRSGSQEILVQPLASEGGPWQVSQSGGGGEPLFAKGAADRELFYRRQSDGAMMSVRYSGETTFEIHTTEELFPDNRYRPREGLDLRSYDVSRDSSRFLMVQEADPSDSPLRIGVFQDWLEEVKRREQSR